MLVGSMARISTTYISATLESTTTSPHLGTTTSSTATILGHGRRVPSVMQTLPATSKSSTQQTPRCCDPARPNEPHPTYPIPTSTVLDREDASQQVFTRSTLHPSPQPWLLHHQDSHRHITQELHQSLHDSQRQIGGDEGGDGVETTGLRSTG